VHQRCLAGAIERNDDDHFERPDGSIKYNRWECRPWRRANGEIGGIITYTEVTTERKMAEKALREREQRLSNIYETLGDSVFHLAVEPGGEFRFVSINRSFSDVTGLKPEEIVGKRVSEIIPEPSLTLVLANYRRAIEGKTIVRWEETSDYPTGQLVGEVSVAPVFDDQGRCTHLVGSVHDVTERKRAAEALKASEEKFRMITEQTADLISITDADGVITYVSPASRALFLYEPEEMRGRQFKEFLDPSSVPEAVATFRKAMTRGGRTRALSLKMKRKDGTVFIGELTGSDLQVGGREGSLVVIRDITERTRTLEEIRKLSTVVEQSTEGIAIADLDGTLTYINNAWCRMHGYESSRDLLGKSLDIFLSPEQIANDVKPFVKKVKELGAFSGEAGHVTRDGRVFPTLMTASLLKDGQGKPYALVGIAKDITERKRAEEILQESGIRLNKLATWVPGMIYQFKRPPEGSYSVPFSTEAIRNIFGCSPEDVREDFSPIASVLFPDDFARVVASIESSAERLTVWECEYRVRIPGGPVRWMLGTATPERSADGSVTWYGYNMDITERKEMEEAVHASLREKETLLREIHHRVKNNMQVISSLFNLQAGYIADEDARRMLKEGQLRIRSMALIHEKLYQARDLSKIEFASYIQSLTVHLFQFFNIDPGQVRLESDLEDVRLDINTAVPCGLLVSELVSNALKHAFPDGRKGTVRIRLKREKDGLLKLMVADDGGRPKEGNGVHDLLPRA
jgi:PAS domain S-box-containing protein